jgi:tRNA1Val (adenine37-N6)-methyltransferase
MSKPFTFKEFTVAQDHCAMKIGTDGVLLGAWVPIDHLPNSILDMGAGTGLIALMLAQRTHAETIDGIEVIDMAYEQCVVNFENSPWADRLFCYHADVKELLEEAADMAYDLIVSNPPFYSEDNLKNELERSAARESSALPFPLLLQASAALLSKKGVFALVLPFKEEAEFIKLAAAVGLFPQQIMRVQGHATAEIKRTYMAFGFEKAPCRQSLLVIETTRHQYTPEYKALVKDFYLKM